mmetsp:Transcript_5181/g.15967  ORF Transcript_5181/g.15967 Transcript_5181/m.15967 type:complete len:241 (-) Transcript_5181:134-856(-)
MTLEENWKTQVTRPFHMMMRLSVLSSSSRKASTRCCMGSSHAKHFTSFMPESISCICERRREEASWESVVTFKTPLSPIFMRVMFNTMPTMTWMTAARHTKPTPTIRKTTIGIRTQTLARKSGALARTVPASLLMSWMRLYFFVPPNSWSFFSTLATSSCCASASWRSQSTWALMRCAFWKMPQAMAHMIFTWMRKPASMTPHWLEAMKNGTNRKRITAVTVGQNISSAVTSSPVCRYRS